MALIALVAGGLLTAALAIAAHTATANGNCASASSCWPASAPTIAERFDEQQQRLDEQLRRFFSFSSEITPREFDGYARPLLQRTLAYAWAPRVEAAQRAEFERLAE